MLNERAYIKPHRLALQWALGCALTAVKERVSYELEKTSMSRKLLKTLLGLGGAFAVGALGIYIDTKPYQRDRIWIARASHTFRPARRSTWEWCACIRGTQGPRAANWRTIRCR
jgi:hypothetical protein